MGRHTLRNLGDPDSVVVKKAPKKNGHFFEAHISILLTLVILVSSTIIANVIFFSKNHFYLNGCTLGYQDQCNDGFRNDIIIYVVLIILPIAFAAYAAVRAFQKHQIKSGIISIILISISIATPILVSYLCKAQIDSYQDTLILSIKTPANQSDCSLIGITDSNPSSSCKIQSGSTPYRVAKRHNSAVIPLDVNGDQIVVHLDSDLNIFNITSQDLHICTYFNGDPTPSCQELPYSNTDANTFEDGYYQYSYLNNQLIISSKLESSN